MSGGLTSPTDRGRLPRFGVKIQRIFPLVFAAVTSMAVSARAQNTPTAHVDYAVEGNVSHCPSESSFHNAISARLGYDPFHDDAPMSIVATIARTERLASRTHRDPRRGGASDGHADAAISRGRLRRAVFFTRDRDQHRHRSAEHDAHRACVEQSVAAAQSIPAASVLPLLRAPALVPNRRLSRCVVIRSQPSSYHMITCVRASRSGLLAAAGAEPSIATLERSFAAV